ncbi:hypothetical protein BJ508DRAFT_315706 [Ascobolus immersus RN42]|uniref:Uncharacterized protein n=1 Tax=Ascobolus immersus RN42 TaxID=1160509 RepID=A0A3N4HGZ2_ASCIM|nr:hypothetical protein BJ508DRAFT_315706 [Ascobolus immersus RN42]
MSTKQAGFKVPECFSHEYIFGQARQSRRCRIVRIGATDINPAVANAWETVSSKLVAKRLAGLPFNDLASMYALAMWRRKNGSEREPTVGEIRREIKELNTGGCCYNETKDIHEEFSRIRKIAEVTADIQNLSDQDRRTINNIVKSFKLTETMVKDAKTGQMRSTRHTALICRDVYFEELGADGMARIRKGVIVLDMDLTRRLVPVWTDDVNRYLAPGTIRLMNFDSSKYGTYLLEQVMNDRLDEILSKDNAAELLTSTEFLAPMAPYGTLVDIPDTQDGAFKVIYLGAADRSMRALTLLVFFGLLSFTLEQRNIPLPNGVDGAENSETTSMVTSYILRADRDDKRAPGLREFELLSLIQKKDGTFGYVKERQYITLAGVRWILKAIKARSNPNASLTIYIGFERSRMCTGSTTGLHHRLGELREGAGMVCDCALSALD